MPAWAPGAPFKLHLLEWGKRKPKHTGVGIPAFSVDAGTLYEGHDRAWGVAQEKNFNDNHYHNFSDNFDQAWHFSGDANLARFGIDLGWQVINAPHTVEWK